MQVWSVVWGKDGRERFGHTFQTVSDGDQDVLAAARFQVSEDLHPEFRALGLLDPQPVDIAAPVRQHGQDEIDRRAAHVASSRIFTQCVEEHDRIHRLEQAASPRGHVCHDAVGDRADQIRRDFHAVHLAEKPWGPA